ncbi:hypothetical protein Tco_0600589 [Tanacetum coccineum]
MADSAWIEAMQEELHQFDRLQVWELVDKPFGKNVIKLKWLWKNKKVDTRKSTSGGIKFLGDKLVSWMSKKQDCTVMSSAEAEYVALSATLPYKAFILVFFHQGTWLKRELDEMVDSRYGESLLAASIKQALGRTGCGSLRRSWVRRTSKPDCKIGPTEPGGYIKYGDGDCYFQLGVGFHYHIAHAQTQRTYNKHQDSRIIESSIIKDKDFRTNSYIQIIPSKISSLAREDWLARFQDDCKFEHEHVVMNPTPAGMRHHHLHLYVDSKNSLTWVSSSKRRVFLHRCLDLPWLACSHYRNVSKQKNGLLPIEISQVTTKSLFVAGQAGFPSSLCVHKDHSDVLAITRIMR